MLVSLSIKNVALITQADVEFTNGLNVLSGETGAGKSVILDSLNFVLGAKADKTMIRHGEQFCLVSCVFKGYPSEVEQILREYDIEICDELVIKRKFDINGNGYIKLNGENLTATMLRKITSHLVDVHGQSEHFSLLSKTKQLECIDEGAGVSDILTDLSKTVCELRDVEGELSRLGGNEAERLHRIDVLEYQINEIEKANLKEGEKEELVCLKNKLNNLEKLSNAFGNTYNALNNEGGAIDCILTAEQGLKSISDIDVNYQKLLDKLRDCREEISDVAESVNDYLENLDGDGLNIDEIEQRLEIYHSFSRKYGTSVSDINNFLENAINERDSLINFEKNTAELIKKLEQIRKKAYKQSVELSEKRRSFAKKFEKAVTLKLAELGMPNSKFLVQFEEIPALTTLKTFSSSGIDKIEFLFSANAGEPVKPLSKIISGGEMSRFMLALKTQLSFGVATYVFDEIDAGISGVTALIVAKQFAQIAKNRQIVAISHLPQISAMSDNALLICKKELKDKTYTEVKALTSTEKVNEIIRLIGGRESDETAIKHATNMIREANEYKTQI